MNLHMFTAAYFAIAAVCGLLGFIVDGLPTTAGRKKTPYEKLYRDRCVRCVRRGEIT